MDHVDRVSDGDRVDRPIGPAFVIGRNLHHAAAETMQRFGFGALLPQLGRKQGIPDVVLHASRKGLHVGPGVGEPRELLHGAVHAHIGIVEIAASKDHDRPR